MASTVVLTKQEHRVLRLLAGGDSNIEIGRQLFLSPETIKTHLQKLCWKVHAKNRTHLVAIAYEQNLLERGGATTAIASASMAPVSRAIARHQWMAAVEMLVEAGVPMPAALVFVAGERERVLEAGRPPARDRAG